MMKKTICIIYLITLVVYANAQGNKLKATYLYQFAKILEWPDASESFTIGVWGDSEVAPVLDVIASTKKIGSKALVIEKIVQENQLSDCQIIFVPNASKSKLPAIIKASQGQNILIVGDGSGLSQQGAGMNFVEINGKVLFELNKSNMAKNGLISIKLLERLAHKVY